MMPKSYVRLSAGREEMHDAVQALCFFAGANSVFFGDKLLTAANASADHDMELLARLGLKPKESDSERSASERSDSERSVPVVCARLRHHVDRATGKSTKGDIKWCDLH